MSLDGHIIMTFNVIIGTLEPYHKTILCFPNILYATVSTRNYINYVTTLMMCSDIGFMMSAVLG